MFILSFFLTILTGGLSPAILCHRISALECLALSFPLGLGINTLLIWSALVFRFPLSSENFIASQAVLAIFLLYLNRHHNTSLFKAFKSIQNIFTLFPLVILLLFGFSVLFNLKFPVFISDGIGYKIHGTITVANQSLFLYEDYIKILGDQNRTLGFHLVSGYCKLFAFQFPKIFQSLTYLSFVSLFYLGIRRFVAYQIGQSFTALLASAPMVWWQSFLYLNNLLAGFYFFGGILFWHRAIHEKRPRYLLLSSLIFMLSAWVRYEFIVYYGLFLANVYFWALRERRFEAGAFFISFPLVFSGIWTGYSVVFYSEMIQTLHFIFIFLFYLLSFFLFIFIYFQNYRVETTIKFFIATFTGILLFTVGIGLWNEKVSLIFHVFLSKVIWNILNQSVWGFSVLLVLVIPFYNWKSFFAQRYLLINLAFLFFGISLLLAVVLQKSTLLNYSIIDKIYFFFESPGRIASRTSAREYLAFFPALLLFLGVCIGGNYFNSSLSIKINAILFRRSWFNGINAFIVGNLVLISSLFLFPRIEFLLKNYNRSYEELLTTSGSRDNINIYQPTYKIAQAIRLLTPRNSVIILPYPYGALKWKQKPYDSLGVFATYDTLYPRIIYWKGFEDKITQKLPALAPIYRVIKGDNSYETCGSSSWKRNLGYYNWFICREEKFDLTEYQ